MKILVLEDTDSRNLWFKQRFIRHSTDFAYSAQEAIEFLNAKEYDAIFLDHDLYFTSQTFYFSGVGTGYEVVEWLVENKNNLHAHIVVHSCNPAGADRMYNRLKLAGYNVERMPYHILQQRLKVH